MSVGLTYPHIDSSPGQPARLRRVPRVRMAQIVMGYLAHGWSADEICRQHRYLTPAEAHAALAYYFDQQAEIDAGINAEWDWVREDRAAAAPSPFLARMLARGML